MILNDFILFNQKAFSKEDFIKWYNENKEEWNERANTFMRECNNFLYDLSLGTFSGLQAEIRFNEIYSKLFNIPPIHYMIVTKYGEHDSFDEKMLFSTVFMPDPDTAYLSISRQRINELLTQLNNAKKIEEQMRNHYKQFIMATKSKITDKEEAQHLLLTLYYEHKTMFDALKKNDTRVLNSNYYDLFYARQANAGKEIEGYIIHLVERHAINARQPIPYNDFFRLISNLNLNDLDTKDYYHIQSVIIKSLNTRAGSISGDIVLLDSQQNILLNFQLKSVASARTVIFGENLRKTMYTLLTVLQDPNALFKLYADSYSIQMTHTQAQSLEQKVIQEYQERLSEKIDESNTIEDIIEKLL